MTTMADIRDALATVLSSALPDIKVERVPVDSISPPSIVIIGPYHRPDSVDGTSETTLNLVVAVSRRHSDQIDLLDELTDPRSSGIIDALNADDTLGGVVHWCVWESSGDYRVTSYGAEEYYAATVKLRLLY